MAFLKNAWYVANWSDALKPGELMPLKILGEDVVFFRDLRGQVAAMQDRCPHRFIPLYEGLLGGDKMVLPSVREEAGHLDDPSVFDMNFRYDGQPVDVWRDMRPPRPVPAETRGPA